MSLTPSVGNKLDENKTPFTQTLFVRFESTVKGGATKTTSKSNFAN